MMHGKYVGTDQLGNRYFTEKNAKSGMRAKRWVRYRSESVVAAWLGFGLPDPSAVPPEWHGWLHYTLDTPPTERPLTNYAWQKPPKANMSGTPEAYLPPGHLLKGGHRAPAASDYQPWQPE